MKKRSWHGSWIWSEKTGAIPKMKYLVESALILVLWSIFRILPRRAGLYLGRMIGRSGYYLASGRRRLTLDNLRLALGAELSEGQIRETALGSFEHLGMNIAEFFKLPSLNRENIGRHTFVEGEENLVEALEMGKGVLVLSSHLGNWDMLSAGLALRGYPAGLITKIAGSEALNRIWMRYRRDLGIELFMGRGTMKETIRHLRKGGMVGFALDQNARRREGIFVHFFGREACTITSLALLARRTGAPVVPVYTYREGDVHHIVVEKPLLHDDDRLDADADILEKTRIYTQWTEKIIRLHPDQWTWLHNRWKTRPMEESKAQGPKSKE